MDGKKERREVNILEEKILRVSELEREREMQSRKSRTRLHLNAAQTSKQYTNRVMERWLGRDREKG